MNRVTSISPLNYDPIEERPLRLLFLFRVDNFISRYFSLDLLFNIKVYES